MSLIQAFKDDSYRYGNLQSLDYKLAANAHLFKPNFLSEFYMSMRGDSYSKRDGLGVISATFCGMDPSHNSVVAYLASKPVCAMGVWTDEQTFLPIGILFITLINGNPKTGEASCFAGFCFQKAYWGSDEQESLTVLGIAQIFGDLNVKSIHGVRYATNHFTAHYMAKFGFMDLVTVPNHLARKDKIVDGVVSTLSREKFESNLIERILKGSAE
jgi:hypothetical protein